jgi:CheY-like chemotaxis protein/signal transduction histidine kinase
MRSTFRNKLLAIVAVSTTSALLVLWISVRLGAQVHDQLVLMRDQYVPLIELGPALESRLEDLKRGLQDAVAASDVAQLEKTQELKARLLDKLAAARQSMDPEVSAKLRGLVESYYGVSYDVSRRMIAGETGESTLQDMERMQLRSREVTEYLKAATTFDRSRLMRSFSVAIEAQERAAALRLAGSLAGVFLVCAFSLWLTRTTLRSLNTLVAGLDRFGAADFTAHIQLFSNDELGVVAQRANQMADALLRSAEGRARSDWVKEGIANLSDIVREDRAPGEAAARILKFLVARVDAIAGAVYLTTDDGVLELASQSGLSVRGEGGGGLPERVRLDEGLLGRAALGADLQVIDEPPAGFLRIETALGAGSAGKLVFVPLRRGERSVGVIELAFFADVPESRREFLSAAGTLISTAAESAMTRNRVSEMLEETRQQAGRLAVQEEELRETNHELLTQQEELRTANEALETHRSRLAAQNAEIEAARGKLEEKATELQRMSAFKSQFLANMSHELRTPLNSMLLLSHLLSTNESQNLTAKQVEYCKTVHGAGKDLLNLINQILDLAKIEAGRQEVYVERVPIAEVLEHIERVFAPLAAEKRLDFSVEIAPGVPDSLRTDRSRLERILTNLLGNAIKFTPAGRVALRVYRPSTEFSPRRADLSPEKALAFAVSDTGIGIPPDALERVFAPFEQLESRTDRRYGGSGLGLAISRESALLLGGELHVESSPGKGSVFTCLVPDSALSARPAHGNVPVPSSPPRVVPDDRPALEGLHSHLLVIEDDPVLVEQLVDVIHGRSLKVVVATTGEEGVRLARVHRPYGIILDVRLPDIDGWTVMERLRREPETADIPVHVVSAVDGAERGFALGAVGYLRKPVTKTELVDVVRTLAPSSPEEPVRVLIVEDNAAAALSMESLLAGEGFRTLHVGTASEARRALASGPFDCMILDLGLPDMDGLGLLEALHEDAAVEHPPVVVYTGRALTRDEARRLDTYAQAVVLKDGESERRLIDEIRLFVGRVKERAPRPQVVPTTPSETLRGARLVLVDDDMRTVYALSALLRGKGAEVFVAENGREGVALVRQHPDVQGVLMDIMMPEMDGYEAMRQLRKDERFAHLPLIALTAKAMKGERERCIEAGASDYLPKPIDADQLLQTLNKWLSPGARA